MCQCVEVPPRVCRSPLAHREFQEGAWRWPHSCGWWSGHTSFDPHLLKKYDRTINPTEFLQIYSTSILATGGDEAVMANYITVALTGMARSWLMILPEGTLDSWSELCHQFTANFESAYARPGNETDLHTIWQRQGESLRSFIQRFSQVCNTILVSPMLQLWWHFGRG
jgi:hypothetical protein